MRVLITGVAGFLGGHVADYFKKQGWEVVGMDNLTNYELKRAGFNPNVSRIHNMSFLLDTLGIEFHNLDCRYCSKEDFKEIDFIIHCAAQPAMTIALEDPKYDAEDNILSCVNMLNIAKELKIPMVNCSSIHVYGNALDNNLVEEDTRFKNVKEEFDEETPILQGELTPLHVSKFTTELYTTSFAEMYGMKTASFRITGMYGERQFGGMDHGWVANFAIRTIMDRDITIFGTDKQVRDILYAEDVARAFFMWYTNGCPVGIFNLGGGMKNSISLKECIEKLNDLTLINTGIYKCSPIHIEPKRKGDLWYFVCDYKKAKREFDWEPNISVDEGLKKITKWIEENKELFK
jgi:CDP-paratose 2-epimerase